MYPVSLTFPTGIRGKYISSTSEGKKEDLVTITFMLATEFLHSVAAEVLVEGPGPPDVDAYIIHT